MRKILIPLFIDIFISILPLAAERTVLIKSLKEAIEFSLANNEVLLVDRLTAHINGSKLKKDIGAFFPKINIAFSDSALINLNSSDYRNKNFSIGFSFLAYDGGERNLEYKLKLIENYFSQLQINENINEHLIRIMETYYEYQKELMSKKNLYKTIENAKQYKLTLEKELSLGMILETDILDYEIKLLELENNLVKQTNKIEKTCFLIKELLGLTVEDQLEIQEEDTIIEPINEPFENIEFLLKKAINNSNERKRMVAEIEYDKKLKKLEKTFYKPRISLEPSIGFEGDEFPMHGPKYQLMFSFSFDRNPFISFQGSQSFTREKTALTGAVSYCQSNSKNDFTWKEKGKLDLMNRRKQIMNLNSYDESLKVDLHHRIMEINGYIKTIEMLKKEISLNSIKAHFLEKEIEKGIKCPADLLELQIIIADKNSSLYENAAMLKIQLLKLKFIVNKNIGDFNETYLY